MAEVILMYLIDRDPELKGHVVVTSDGAVHTLPADFGISTWLD
jgi:hypothetical protein